MSGFIANNDMLMAVFSMIKETQTPSNEAQQRALQTAEQLSQNTSYGPHLALILSAMPTAAELDRQLAGLLLKNQLKSAWSSTDAAGLAYIKERLIAALQDQSQMIRSTAAICISTIVGLVSFSGWPELLPALVQLLGNTADTNSVEGSLAALSDLCEDFPTLLDSDLSGRVLNVLVPSFIQLMGNPKLAIKKYAMGCIFPLLSITPQILVVHMNGYLGALFNLAQDPAAEIRKEVCRALVTLFEISPQHLEPHMDGLVNFMMFSSCDSDPVVAIEACDFWNALCETTMAYELLEREGRVHKLIPILLRGMIYSDNDLDLIGADAEESRPDQEQDLRPKFHKGQMKGAQDEDNKDEDDEDEEDATADWNLRKCCASALDLLSDTFAEDILGTLLSNLNAMLSSTDWKHRECAILAIGAVAKGCAKGFKDHLPALFPFLLQCLSDPKPLVRSIDCWTMSRFASWVAGEDPSKYLAPMVQGLLRQMLDPNKRVQEAACSAFATLEESACDRLGPYMSDILQTFVVCLHRYQTHNLFMLYDTIGTLADSVTDALANPEHATILVTPLLQRLGTLKDHDRTMCPLLECLTSIANALGPMCISLAEPCWNRCTAILINTIRLEQAAQQGGAEPPSTDFLIYPIDFMSAICDAIKNNVEPLVATGTISQILTICAQSTTANVLQSTFALCGDLFRTAFASIKSSVPNFVPFMINNLDNIKEKPVANNACWALGELALRMGAEMVPYVNPILDKVVPILTNPQSEGVLRENIAITLGRLSIACPDAIAPHIGHFFSQWCVTLLTVRDESERDSAYRGLNIVLARNPTVAAAALPRYVEAVIQFRKPARDLETEFATILREFKRGMGEQWEAFTRSIPPRWATDLQVRFGL